MIQECYLANSPVNENTWIHFVACEQKMIACRLRNDVMTEYYERITGYGTDVKFAFNPNGQAVYIDKLGNIHAGIWFEIGTDKRVAIFNA